MAWCGKSSGDDTTPISVPFYIGARVDAEAGSQPIMESYDLTGGRLNFGLNNLTNFGKMILAAAPLSLEL